MFFIYTRIENMINKYVYQTKTIKKKKLQKELTQRRPVFLWSYNAKTFLNLIEPKYKI